MSFKKQMNTFHSQKGILNHFFLLCLISRVCIYLVLQFTIKDDNKLFRKL